MGKILFCRSKTGKNGILFSSRCKTETEVVGWGGSGYFSYPFNGQTFFFAVVL